MIIFILIFLILFACVFFYFYPLYKKPQEGFIVFTFHNIGRPPKNCSQKHLWISEKKFKNIIKQISKNGFSFVNAKQVLEGKFPKKSALITFDNGYENFYTHAWPILKELKIPFLCFLVVGYIDSCNFWHDSKKGPWQNMLSSGQIKELQKNPLSAFGSKTLNNQNLTTSKDKEILENEIKESAFRLKKQFNINPNFFAYPYSAGFDKKEIKTLVSDTYPLQFADTGKLNKVKNNFIGRVQIKPNMDRLNIYTIITGRKEK